jgi:L-ascorbate metabolism protein UlaG (beta-lactamase superfamily)
MPSRRAFLGTALCLGLSAAACYTSEVARTRAYHPSDADVSVTRIVHGSVIVDFRETHILVDPWYTPSPPLGPREPIGLAIESLPPIRGILITHKHDDHYDETALRNFPNKSIRVVARRGLGAGIKALGYQDVVELEDWEQSQIGSVVLTAVPARHGVDENGYVLTNGGATLYLAGDTQFDERQFREIAKRFPKLDGALLPVGGIRIMGRRLDMSPDEAADAAVILKAGNVIPYHYGLTGPFPFATYASSAAEKFRTALEQRSTGAGASVVILEPGESWHHYR